MPRRNKLYWDLAYLFGAPWEIGKPHTELEELVESGRLKPGKALDIGCGTGTNVVYLASKGFGAFGLDISSVAVWRAKRKASRHGVKCEIYRLDFTDPKAVMSAGLPTFDLFIDAGCYHSLSPEDRDMYRRSLLHLSHRGTVYLLWCFLTDSRRSYGPPGVSPKEVEIHLSKEFQMLEKREVKPSHREMLFYVMERRGS